MKAALFLLFVIPATVAPQIDPELAAYLASRRKLMDDASRPIADRETVAIELAAALDRAAWASPEPAKRRALWSEARGLLDGFSSRNPAHPRARLFAYQGAVYLWAEGQSWTRQAQGSPTDLEAPARAASAYEAAAARLRPLLDNPAKVEDALTQNIRFRLAQALLDLARTYPERPAAPTLRAEALTVLDTRPFTEKGLIGYAHCLRADLLAAEGRFDEAHEAYEAATRAEVPPPIGERLATLIPIAAARDRVDEARAALDKAELDDVAKDPLRLKLALAERTLREPGKARDKAESEAFRIVGMMKSARRSEASPALIELARSIDEPSPTQEPAAWSLLAEGAALLGENERAATLDIGAAAKAEASGDAPRARESRFRAAALLFQAGRFVRAAALLEPLANDEQAGPLRARAGMLRALALGRGLDAGAPGITSDRYLKALSDQIAMFPGDPTVGEATWLLGRLRLERGEREEAEKLWGSISRTQGRWIDARLAQAALDRNDLEEQKLVKGPEALRQAFNTARKRLEALATESGDDADRIDLTLESVRLELITELGDPTAATATVERLQGLPLRTDQRRQVDHFRLVALSAAGNFLEAETAAQNLPEDHPIDAALAIARDLDHLASTTAGERASKRIGGVLRIVADRLAARKGLSDSVLVEARLRQARGKMLAGDLTGARTLLETEPTLLDPHLRQVELLADYANVLAECGLLDRAIVAARAVTGALPTGSPRWFAARLAHARALEASRRRDAARKLIEGTSVLYPELGGPAMKRKFEGLKSRLDRP